MLTIFEELVSVAICSRSNLRSTGLLVASRSPLPLFSVNRSQCFHLVES